MGSPGTGSVPVPETDLVRIRRFCEKQVPPEMRDQGRVEHRVRGPTMTIVEPRPPWNPASKLLANDDRWADTSTSSRDLIVLAMMKPDAVALKAGGRKAVVACGL